MAEIKTNDRLGERGPDRGYVEDRERIVRSKHLTRTIDHLHGSGSTTAESRGTFHPRGLS